MEVYCFGTGGLVRAYSEALTKAIDNAEIVQKELGYIVCLKVNYSDSDKLKYYLVQNNIKVINIEYDENVNFEVEIQKQSYNKLLKEKSEFKFKIIDNKITKEDYIEV